MLSKPIECQSCLGFKWDNGHGFLQSEGSCVLGVALMGEGGGKNEAESGLPFRPYAPAGSILQRIIQGWHGAGYRREQFMIFNTIQCHPPGDELKGCNYASEVINCCKVHRDRIIEQHRPKVILALGDTALQTLTGFNEIRLNRGYPIWNDQYDCWVIGSFHPAFIARGMRNLMPVLREDIRKAVWLAAQDYWMPADVGYQLQPTRDDARAFLQRVKDNPNCSLTVDLENPKIANEEEENVDWQDVPLLQIQFSLAPYEGIVFPWIGEFKAITKELLQLPNPKWGHNSRKYDFPLLERQGFHVAGTWHDTMDAFRIAQSNLSGCYHLQGVGSFFGCDQLWKHRFGEDLGYYGAMDVDAPQRIITQLIPQMQRLGIWETYIRHVVDLEPILVNMQNRGLNRDIELIERLRNESEKELNERRDEITKLIPREIRKFKDFKREPKEVKACRLRLGGHYVDEEELERQMVLEDFERVKTPQGSVFWRRWEQFTCSSQQMQEYCRFKGYKVPKHPKEDRPTMNEWAMKALWKSTKDPVFKMVLEYTEVKTIASRYLAGDWMPKSDGKTHTTFFSARTSSGQFSSRNPNTQQIPRD